MRIPTRRSEKNNLVKPDLRITQVKFDELSAKLERLKKIRPGAAAEVGRLAAMGDFSENAAYQIAKGRLRGINSRISETEYLLNHAVIIESCENNLAVQLGHTVTLEANGKQKKYKILGSAESDPPRGVISDSSPIGSALISRRAGEIIKIKLNNREIEYKIIKIE
ncbi:MAG: GreA/GreB family elongation factor [Patescibacteria group bacterium]